MCTIHSQPTTFVIALVTITQVTSHTLNSLLNASSSTNRTASDNISSTFEKTGFVPLLAGTGLPVLATDIAELCTTTTAIRRH